MERTLIRDLHAHIEKPVTIAGSVSVRRDQGKMVFLDIRDRSGVIQAVALPKGTAIEAAKELSVESVASFEGIVHARPEKNANPDVENGDIELELSKITLLGKAEALPFELGADINLDTRLDRLPITLREERSRDIFRIQSDLVESFRSTLCKHEFVEFQAPALVGADAEGGAAAFPVEYYYGKKAYLATSPQFYKQIMVGVFERVFSTPKVFRGEKHSTTRHLSEYTSMDFEMGFIKDHRDVMAVLEDVMRGMVSMLESNHVERLKRLGAELPLLPNNIPVLKLREAQEILDREFNASSKGEPDLDPEHERQLCDWAKREKGSDFVFITHYPVSKRPFYTYEDEADAGYTKSFDLLFKGLEITTGGQRIHDYDTLVQAIEKKGLAPETFAYYLEAFKHGMPPHGGSATGLERLTARILNLPNVKEATLFPRDLNRIDTLLSEPPDHA